MSSGLERLLEAAKYIEQQEKCNTSPQHAPSSLHHHSSSTQITYSIPNKSSNSLLNINQHHHQQQQQQHVSLSAPAGSAPFTHLNGLTNGNGVVGGGHGVSIGSNGQLLSSPSSTSASSLAASTTIINTGTNQHKQHDYEFTSSIGSGHASTISSKGISSSSNGRSNDARMSEDEDSSEISVCDSPTRISNNSNSSPANVILLPAATSIALEKNDKILQQQQQQDHEQAQTQSTTTTTKSKTATLSPGTSTLLLLPSQQFSQFFNTKSSSASTVPIVSNNVVASKQRLLNNGARIAGIATTTTENGNGNPAIAALFATNSNDSSPKALPIPLNGKILQQGTKTCVTQSSSNVFSLSLHNPSTILSSGTPSANATFESYINPNNSNNSSIHNKSLLTLTPPPMPNRKFIEPTTPTRIRSHSLSSHKFSANQLIIQQQQNNGGSGSGSGNINNNSNGSSTSVSGLIFDDIHQSPYGSGSGAHTNRSPPRGSSYAHMLQQGAGSQLTSPIHNAPSSSATSGRRRTISSNSNGAGTREVHNKLEKNRRAHLKECYDVLKQTLNLKDEDRKKISNLSILAEAHKSVKQLQQEAQDAEAEHEKLAKEKINLQKRINFLKRESGTTSEAEMASTSSSNVNLNTNISTASTTIPNEKETTLNETSSLSSGRGSMLYSSTSSLSSGGSNTMSSPVGAGLQTAMPTAISPVICKTISNTTSPASPNNHNISNNNMIFYPSINNNNGNTVLQQIKSINISSNPSPAGSPNTLISTTNKTNSNAISINLNNNNNSMPLSLTAKNISATSVTRGSPTPSTPSSSPTSSSSISSTSSSLISSSPPIMHSGVAVGIGGNANGTSVITGRNTVTVNIPNGLKFPNVAGATIGNSSATAAATIIATTTPGNGTNTKAYMLQAVRGCH